MAVELATAYVNLVPSAKGISSKLGRELGGPIRTAARAAGDDAGKTISNSVGTRLSGATRAIGKAATIAFAGVGIAVGALAGFGIKAAASFQQTRIAFEGILGSAQTADKFLQQLRAFAAKTPFEFPELATAAKNLLAVGFNARDVIPVMTQLGNVAATLGVGGQEILGVVRALGQMKGKGKASAEELNQITEQLPGFSSIQAIADDMGISVQEAFAKMQQGAITADSAISAILKGMDKFPGAAGAMIRQSLTLNGVLSTFKDTLRDTLINAIEPILPAISTAITDITPLLQQALGGLVGAIAPVLPVLLKVITQAVDAIAPVLSSVLKSLSPFLKELGDTFSQTFVALKPVFDALAPTVAELGSSFLLIVKAILPVLPAIGRLVAAVAPLGEALGGLLVRAVQVLVPLITPLIGTLTSLTTAFIGNQEAPGPLITLLGLLGGAVETLGKVLGPVIPIIADLAAELVQGLAPVLPDLAKSFTELLVALVPLVPPLVKLAVVLLREIGVTAIVAIAQAFGFLAAAVTPLARQTAILTPLLGALFLAFATSKGITAVQNGLLGVSKAAGTAFGTLQRHQATIANAAQSLLNFGRASLTAAVNAVKSTAAFVAQKTAMIASAIATKVLTVAQAALNLVMTANPIGLVIVAVAALAAGIFFAYKKFKPFRDIVDAVGRALAGVFQFVRRNWKLLLGLLVAPFITVPILIVKNFSKVTAFLSKFGGILGKAGIALMRALGVGIVKGIQALAILFIGVPILIVKLLVQGQILLARKGVELIRFLVGGFISALPTIAAFFVSLPGKILGFIGNVAAILVPKAIELMTGFVGALIGAQIAVATFFLGLPGRIVTFVGKLATTLVSKALELIAGFALGLLQAIPRVFTFFVSLPSRIIGAFGALGTKLIPKALELIAGFMVGLFEAQHKIFDFFIHLPGKIVGWLGKLGDILLEAGKDIIKGLFDGMKEGVKGGAGFVNDNVVKPVKGFVTNPFGIFSPSKWAADVVGKNIILGIAEGLVKNTKIIDGTLAGVVGNFDPTLGVNAGTFAVGASSAGRSAPNVNIENLFARDDRDVARVVGDQQRRAWLLANAF